MIQNDEAIEAWNTVLFEKFVKYRHILNPGMAAHGMRALDRLAVRPGSRIVDLGCGFGDTTVELARRVGPTGHVTGLDAAPRFIDSARVEAKHVENVRFEVADIETGVPGGPYHYAFSRMGMMFFASPVIALRHVRKALAPGGQLAMVVWRKKAANDCLCIAEEPVVALLGNPDKGDQVTCGPGPFSMSSADLVGDQLVAAGFTDIAFARSDTQMLIGRDLQDAIDFALALGPAGEIVRLAGDAAIARRSEIDAALRAALGPFVQPDGVRAASSTWIVTATAPG